MVEQPGQLGDFSKVDSADADDLVGRLDAMRALEAFKAYKAVTFELMRLKAGAKVADLGCGTGADAAVLAETVGERGKVVGFDLSQAMLSAASERYDSISQLSFRQSPAEKIDAPDGAFDAIRADRVLIHVPDPSAALREMKRVVRPGGWVVVSEPDMFSCWVASSAPLLTDTLMDRIAESCRHPYLPRDLLGQFRAAGLEDVSYQIYPVTAFTPLLVERILDFEGTMRSLVEEGAVDIAAAQEWGEDIMRRAQEGRFAAAVPIMIAAGKKP
jgi:ubiquinone/menaquinone biosynthesis C-methylase UbiE